MSLSKVNPEEQVALIIPSGRGPERVRMLAREEAVKIVKHFVWSGKPVAATYRGP